MILYYIDWLFQVRTYSIEFVDNWISYQFINPFVPDLLLHGLQFENPLGNLFDFSWTGIEPDTLLHEGWIYFFYWLFPNPFKNSRDPISFNKAINLYSKNNNFLQQILERMSNTKLRLLHNMFYQLFAVSFKIFLFKNQM